MPPLELADNGIRINIEKHSGIRTSTMFEKTLDFFHRFNNNIHHSPSSSFSRITRAGAPSRPVRRSGNATMV